MNGKRRYARDYLWNIGRGNHAHGSRAFGGRSHRIVAEGFVEQTYYECRWPVWGPGPGAAYLLLRVFACGRGRNEGMSGREEIATKNFSA